VKPARFRYERPETVEEAVALLTEHGEEAKTLAGGQSLVPMLNMRLARPAVLVDVNRVPLGDVTDEDGVRRVGATVRQSDSRLLTHPLLAEAIPSIGHFVTRNRGTVAGSIVHADAAAELPVALTLLGGSVRARSGRGEREIGADEFFVTHYTTVLEPDELVVETVWPQPEAGSGYAFCELALRRGDYGLCMAAAAAGPGALRVVLGSVVDRPTLVDVDPDRPGESAAAQIQPYGNLHASAAYLRNLTRVLVERAVSQAKERATRPAGSAEVP
jgi:CO/xanthine dehydrogenase FAD-binding subunit